MKKQPRKARWSHQDIILSRLFFFGGLFLLGLSVINLQAIIVGAGHAEFMGAGVWKSWALGSLSALAGMSLKIPPMAMDFPETRRAYNKCIYGITIVIASIWVVLVASYFNPDVSITELIQTGNDKRPLLMAQISMEIFLGASFFLAWGSLEDKYSSKPPSREALTLDKHIKILEPQVAAANQRIYSAMKNVERIKTNHQVFVNQQLEKLSLLSAQRSDQQSFFEG